MRIPRVCEIGPAPSATESVEILNPLRRRKTSSSMTEKIAVLIVLSPRRFHSTGAILHMRKSVKLLGFLSGDSPSVFPRGDFSASNKGRGLGELRRYLVDERLQKQTEFEAASRPRRYRNRLDHGRRFSKRCPDPRRGGDRRLRRVGFGQGNVLKNDAGDPADFDIGAAYLRF